MLDERTRAVQAGYDVLAPTYLEWSRAIKGEPTERFLDELARRLPDRGRVLDLGCGACRLVARLSDRHDLVGVDISEAQLRLARAEAPEAVFLHGDFTRLDFPDRSFDAVIAIYSFMHVPRDEHAVLFERIARWLKPGGLFLASLSHVGGPDRTDEWLGVEMFFSGFDAATNSRLVHEAGFELLVEELVFMGEPEAEVGFLWVLGRVGSGLNGAKV